MHKTLVLFIFPLHSSVFHHRSERFVKFDAVLHHDLCTLPEIALIPGIALTDAVILGIGEIAIFLPRGLENYYLLSDEATRPWLKRYVEAMNFTHFSWLYACSEITIFTNTW